MRLWWGGEIATERVVINIWLVRTEPRKNLLKGPNSAQETGAEAAHAKLGDAGFKLELRL